MGKEEGDAITPYHWGKRWHNPTGTDEYAHLFSQRLSDSHIQALAALFGLAPPDDLSYNGGAVVQPAC